MLNLLIAMIKNSFLILLTIVIMPFGGMLADSGFEITSPQPGTVLEGVIPITGTVDSDLVRQIEIAFAYSDSIEQSWFLLDQIDAPIEDETITFWDTTGIADGTYALRFRASLHNGEILTHIIPDLRVRNYTMETPTTTSVENSTALALESQNMVASKPEGNSAAEELTNEPTVEKNSAELSLHDLRESAVRGFLFTGLLFIVLGIYFFIRRLINQD
jgi:hypothetical protein